MISESQKWMLLAGLLIIAALLYALSPILTPFLISMVLAYMGDPVADKLEEKGCSRTLAVVICFVVLTSVFLVVGFVVIPMLITQIGVLMELIPQLFAWVKDDALPWVNSKTGLGLSVPDWAQIKGELDLSKTGNVVKMAFTQVSHSTLALVALLANLFLVPVVTFYLLRDWDVLVAKVSDLLPRHYIYTIKKLARECHTVLGAFIQGQLLVMVSLGSIYSVGLTLIGLKLGLVIGMLAGLASIVPYMGLVVGMAAALVAGIFQFGDLLHILLIFVVFGVGQALEGMVLTPLLVGDRIGLHPVAVIFAVMAGGQLFGFVGILIALPVAAVIMVLLRHVHDNYKGSSLYGAHLDNEASAEKD